MATKSSETYLMRPLALADIDTMAGWFSKFDDVALFDRGLPIPVGPEFVKESWRSAVEFADPPRSLWFVAEGENHEPLGVCGIHSINYIHGDGVLPMFVSPDMRGRGLAQAMAVLLIDLAFDRLRMHRLTTFYRADNEGSAKIIERMGFEKEGCIREAWFCDGVHRDVVQVGLLQTEWQASRERVKAAMASGGGVSVAMRRESEKGL